MFVKTVNSNIFKHQLKECISEIEKLNNSPSYLLESKKYVHTDRLLLPILSLYENSRGLNKIFLFFLLESYYGAEKICGDSGKLSLTLSIYFLKELMKDFDFFHYNAHQFENEFEEIKCLIKLLAIPPTMAELRRFISETTNNDFVSSMTREILKLGGLTGKIFIEESRYAYSSIELTRGYTFELEVPSMFFRRENSWRRSWPSCVVIDGIISEVSEVHHLLENFSHDKRPLAIFARNYSNDVISTLKVNFDRETLDVIPFMLPEKIECINNLIDISKVLGADLISPTKGNLISSLDFSSLSRAEEISYHDGYVTILNHRSDKIVELHKKNLERKKNEESQLDLVRILSKRLRSLTSLCTVVRLSQKDLDKHENLDYVLRSIQASLSPGTISRKSMIDKLKKIEDSFLSQVLYSTLLQQDRSLYAALSLTRSIEVLGASILTIINCSSAVVIDE